MLPILYSFRRCPYAIRTRYLLSLVDIKVELREVVLKSKPDALLRLGGRSTVPQLIDVTGQRYPESLDIVLWALQKTPSTDMSQRLWSNNLTFRHKVMAWITYNDRFFKFWLDKYKYADRYPEREASYYRLQGEHFLYRLEKRLSISPYLLGNDVSLADICIFPFIRQFVGVDTAWFQQADYPHVQKWLEAFLKSDIFQLTMTKYLPWSEGNSIITFP